MIVPGEPVTYEILVRNNGSDPYQNVGGHRDAGAAGSHLRPEPVRCRQRDLHPGRGSGLDHRAAPPPVMPAFAQGDAEVIRVTYTVDSDYTTIGTPAGSGSVANTASISAVQTLDGAAVVDAAVLDSDTELLPVAVQGAALHLQKLAVQGVIIPGELVTYLLRVTNIGDQVVTNVVVADPIPGGLSLVNSQFDAASVVETLPGGVPTYTIATLPVHGEQEIALTFRASTDVGRSRGSVDHTATAAGVDEGGNAVAAPDASTDVPVQSLAAALEVSKLGLNSAVVAGQPITYVITVSNTGNVPLTGVVVSDAWPTGLTFVRADAPPDVVITAADPVLFTIATLEIGEDETFSVTFDVDPDPTNLDDPTLNSVTASGTDPSGNTVNAAGDTVTLDVEPLVTGLDLDKVATTGAAVPGEPLTYHITVTNTGNVALTNVSVTRCHGPPGLTFLVAEFDSLRDPAGPGQPQLHHRDPARRRVRADLADVQRAQRHHLVRRPRRQLGERFGDRPRRQRRHRPGRGVHARAWPLPTPALEVSKLGLNSAVIAGQPITYVITVSQHRQRAVDGRGGERRLAHRSDLRPGGRSAGRGDHRGRPGPVHHRHARDRRGRDVLRHVRRGPRSHQPRRPDPEHRHRQRAPAPAATPSTPPATPSPWTWSRWSPVWTWTRSPPPASPSPASP